MTDNLGDARKAIAREFDEGLAEERPELVVELAKADFHSEATQFAA